MAPAAPRFDHSADAILLVDVNYGILQANHAFGRLIGCSPYMYLGRQLSSFCQADALNGIEQVIQATATSKQTHHIESQVLHIDGTTRDVEISFASVTPAAHAVTNLVCIIRDMTQHKRAESERLAQFWRFQLAAEAGGLGVWDWDIPHDQLTWDDRMYALHSLTRHDAPYMPFSR